MLTYTVQLPHACIPYPRLSIPMLKMILHQWWCDKGRSGVTIRRTKWDGVNWRDTHTIELSNMRTLLYHLGFYKFLNLIGYHTTWRFKVRVVKSRLFDRKARKRIPDASVIRFMDIARPNWRDSP